MYDAAAAVWEEWGALTVGRSWMAPAVTVGEDEVNTKPF